jgi:hypothetical protein
MALGSARMVRLRDAQPRSSLRYTSRLEFGKCDRTKGDLMHNAGASSTFHLLSAAGVGIGSHRKIRRGTADTPDHAFSSSSLASFLLPIRLTQQAPIGSVGAWPGPRFPRHFGSSRHSSRVKTLVANIWSVAGGRTDSSARAATTPGRTWSARVDCGSVPLAAIRPPSRPGRSCTGQGLP